MAWHEEIAVPAEPPASGSGSSPDDDQRDYIPLIQRAMRANGVTFRILAERSGISKSRVGKILHSDPARRIPMSFPEFRRILAALDIDILQAIICVESIRDLELLSDSRFAMLIPVLCTMFKELPVHLIHAVDAVEGIDGTEVRPEWAGVLRKSIIQRIIKAMSDTASRRAVLTELEF